MSTLPIYILEAIEEAGCPLPNFDGKYYPSKQARYDNIERENNYED